MVFRWGPCQSGCDTAILNPRRPKNRDWILSTSSLAVARIGIAEQRLDCRADLRWIVRLVGEPSEPDEKIDQLLGHFDWNHDLAVTTPGQVTGLSDAVKAQLATTSLATSGARRLTPWVCWRHVFLHLDTFLSLFFAVCAVSFAFILNARIWQLIEL
jgi:hypothetical protein